MYKYKCAGIGLVALDILINGKTDFNSKIYAGGSCGNVLSILSYLNFDSYPIARLGNNDATELLLEDFTRWEVKLDLIEKEEKGSTPIIIHRILESKLNEPKHRFEFRNPNNGRWLPSFKPVLANKVESINEKLPKVDVFYIDRVSRSSIELAKLAKEAGAIVFFEPSSNKDKKQFEECLKLADILKFSNDRIKSYREEYPNIQVALEIETCGKKGLNYRFKSNSWNSIGAFIMNNAIDTAGAGDWCSAGIIKTILSNAVSINDSKEKQIIDALKYGQALGAINCLYIGARGLMYQIQESSLDEIIRLIMESKPIDSLTSLHKNVSIKNPNNIIELEAILQSF